MGSESTTIRKNRLVGYWLLAGMVMIIVQTVLGGITRLSGSGLSITEWAPVTGVIPPLNEQQWLAEFHKYQLSPQYKYLNPDFNLSDFKHIFFWEWFHRVWARALGVVFAVPFVFFLLRGYFTRKMVQPMVMLFLLGGLQGAIGWIMVASGLVGDATYVAPAKLAVHFVCAMILACYTLWFALELLVREGDRQVHVTLFKWYMPVLLLVFIQLTYGALLAGHKAAMVAPTWPTMNGQWIPGGMTASANGAPFIANKVLVQFIHRCMAYLIFILVLIVSVKAFREKGSPAFYRFRKWPLVLVCMQVLLGIFTLLMAPHIRLNKWGIFETLGLLHQLVAMLFMLSVLVMVYLTSGIEKKGAYRA